MSVENRSVREIEMLRPRLRDGLRFSIQEQRGRRVCVIEDAVASRFHRVGLAEYQFFRQLDGSRTVASIVAQLARDHREDAFTEHEALRMISWLKESHLLAIEGTRTGSDREQNEKLWRSAITWLNPLVVKIPLARPDRFFSAIEPHLRWVLGRLGFALWLLVVLVGALHVAADWQKFERGFDGIFARDNWLWLFLVWVGLKCAHEFSHGLFCKHFGAAVREAGVIFVLFVPMGYVDATASLGLASKWRRITIASAGLYMEFFLAAIAAIVWARTPPGALNTVAHNAVIAGTVLTLFFNANPLMRFDGYYILSDLLEISNLATRGKAWVQRTLGWVLLGARTLKPARPRDAEQWLVAGYGVASSLWQMLVLAGLLVGASVALRGGGLLLAVVAAVTWIAIPAWKYGTSMRRSAAGGSLRWHALVLRAGVTAAVIGAILFVPLHRSISASGIIERADTQTLRAECPGFAAAVHVRDGDLVEQGKLLIELRNEEAAATLVQSRLALTGQELRARLAFTRADVASFQAEQAKAEAMRTMTANHETYLGTLQIRAPFAGKVTSRRLAELPGAFLQAGEEAMQLGRETGHDVKLAVSQEQEPHFRAAIGQPLRVKVAGRSGAFDATLTRVEAQATSGLIHPALTALGDGPVAVRRAETGESEKASNPTAGFELVEPHFAATARLTSRETLFIGETARVRFRSPRSVSVWTEMQRVTSGWLARYTQQGE